MSCRLLLLTPSRSNRAFRESIIFIHGLGGGPQSTWKYFDAVQQDVAAHSEPGKKKSWRARLGVKSPNTSGSASDSKAINWPADLLPAAVPMAKIWTYGYNANVVDGFFQNINKNSILQHGNDFMVKVERGLKNDVSYGTTLDNV